MTKKTKKFISMMIISMLLVFAFGNTVFASDVETIDTPNIYDYSTYGELLYDLYPEEFASLDDGFKLDMYSVSIEDMVNASTSNNELLNPASAKIGITNALVTPVSILKGNITVSAEIWVNAICPSIGISGVIYDEDGDIVGSSIGVSENAVYAVEWYNATGLRSGSTAKAFAMFRVIYPTGSTPSAETLTASAYKIIN